MALCVAAWGPLLSDSCCLVDRLLLCDVTCARDALSYCKPFTGEDAFCGPSLLLLLLLPLLPDRLSIQAFNLSIRGAQEWVTRIGAL